MHFALYYCQRTLLFTTAAESACGFLLLLLTCGCVDLKHALCGAEGCQRTATWGLTGISLVAQGLIHQYLKASYTSSLRPPI